MYTKYPTTERRTETRDGKIALKSTVFQLCDD